jgi:hypothetical protein
MSGLLLLMSGFLVQKALRTGSPLAFVGGTLIKEALGSKLVKKLLATSSFLAFMGSTLIDKVLVGCRLEAMAFILLQFVDCPLPILVGLFCAGVCPMKNGPPRWIRWQQPRGLLVFTKTLLNLFLFAN